MQKNNEKLPEDKLPERRRQVLEAAAKVFFEKGYERATTLDIATEAKVSKRLLYELFGNKQGILEALVKTGTQRMRQPIDIPLPDSADAFYETLKRFGSVFLGELLSEKNIAMTRLAIADASSSGTVAKELAASGSGPVLAATEKLFRHAKEKGYADFDDPVLINSIFFNVLIGDVRIKLLMGAQIKSLENVIEDRVRLALTVIRKLGS